MVCDENVYFWLDISKCRKWGVWYRKQSKLNVSSIIIGCPLCRGPLDAPVQIELSPSADYCILWLLD